MAADPSELTPQELVAQAKAACGYTWAELGERLGRSEKMLRKVAKGESRGEAYRKRSVTYSLTGKSGACPPGVGPKTVTLFRYALSKARLKGPMSRKTSSALTRTFPGGANSPLPALISPKVAGNWK